MAHFVWLPPSGTDTGNVGDVLDVGAVAGDAIEIKPWTGASAVETRPSAVSGPVEAGSSPAGLLLPLPDAAPSQANHSKRAASSCAVPCGLNLTSSRAEPNTRSSKASKAEFHSGLQPSRPSKPCPPCIPRASEIKMK
eukprot:12214388-Karenia_brevis.AAC.1